MYFSLRMHGIEFHSHNELAMQSSKEGAEKAYANEMSTEEKFYQ